MSSELTSPVLQYFSDALIRSLPPRTRLRVVVLLVPSMIIRAEKAGTDYEKAQWRGVGKVSSAPLGARVILSARLRLTPVFSVAYLHRTRWMPRTAARCSSGRLCRRLIDSRTGHRECPVARFHLG